MDNASAARTSSGPSSGREGVGVARSTSSGGFQPLDLVTFTRAVGFSKDARLPVGDAVGVAPSPAPQSSEGVAWMIVVES